MYREVTMIELREVLGLWSEGLPKKRIAAQLGLDPKTVRRYLKVAEKAGVATRGMAVTPHLTSAKPSRSSPKASEGWRRGGDSNPRAGYPTRRFRGAPVTTTSVPLRRVACRAALGRVSSRASHSNFIF